MTSSVLPFHSTQPNRMPHRASEPVSERGVALGELVRLLAPLGAELRGRADVRARGLSQDSRRIGPGDVFAARAGTSADGTRFISAAIRSGATAVLCERGTDLSGIGVPAITVTDVRFAISIAAEALYGFPSHTLKVVGLTGTNGKTTTAWLAAAMLNGSGARAARVGTLGFEFEGDAVEGSLTTPEADAVARYAAEVRRRGATHLVMEASSHALEQRRVEAIHFAVAAFTNLTQDHLDYHATMQAYAAAKQRLFTDLNPEASVINVDDAFGAELAGRARGRVLRVSRRHETAQADVYPLSVEPSAGGVRASVRLPSGTVELESRLVGEHNLDNLLCALGIAEALGVPAERAARALGGVHAVPGRLERCDLPVDDVTVLVDYAHTPDALERVLAAIRAVSERRLICVFGCGGDRDPLKRPLMGAAVARGADHAIVTSDNPRSEPPEAIAAAIVPGLAGGRASYEVELDRARAIQQAVIEASAGDVVLIAGKGHEPYQIVGSEVRRFDDRVEARRALALRRERLGR